MDGSTGSEPKSVFGTYVSLMDKGSTAWAVGCSQSDGDDGRRDTSVRESVGDTNGILSLRKWELFATSGGSARGQRGLPGDTKNRDMFTDRQRRSGVPGMGSSWCKRVLASESAGHSV